MKKEQILKEIRRTADSNGGKPLGWRRFLSETGIKETDWFGIHWARWSDALHEAGYKKNELTEAYNPDELLNKLANLAIRLGKLPTNADYRLRAKEEDGFPSDKTFGRLGTRGEIISMLADYCRARPEYSNVLQLCETYAPRTQKDSGIETSCNDDGFGYVYMFKSGRYYKIGMTNSVGRREYELTIRLPERPVKVHEIRTDDPSGIEAYWHKRFEAKRKGGEWFELDAEDVAAFKRRKFFM